MSLFTFVIHKSKSHFFTFYITFVNLVPVRYAGQVNFVIFTKVT